MDPTFQWPVHFCLLITTVGYILSVITDNVSQVDRTWTFLPTIYTAYFALLPLWPRRSSSLIPYVPLVPYTPEKTDPDLTHSYSPRALLMLAFVVLWMFRLSYNTYRRGLFSLSDEDYRWAVLRKQLHPILFKITNLVFVSGIQNVLLFLLGLPAHIAAVRQPHTPLTTSDFILAALALLVVAIEFTADNQQYSFQSYKYSGVLDDASATKESKNTRVREGSGHSTKIPYNPRAQWPGARIVWTLEDAKRGFVTRGLWAYSRHPNFVCEQTFWWIITLMPLCAPAPPWLPSPFTLFYTASKDSLYALAPLLPAISLSTLFYFSTRFTEGISLSKYPTAYKAYQERVGMYGFVRTWEKGLALSKSGRKTQVEELVWGKGKAA